MADAANVDLDIRKGRTFTRDFQLMTAVINGDAVPRDVAGATFVMQFRSARGAASADLTPVFTAIDLSLGKFNFTATDALTDAMVTTEGVWEIVMTLASVVSTEFEGDYSVILPVVQ